MLIAAHRRTFGRLFSSKTFPNNLLFIFIVERNRSSVVYLREYKLKRGRGGGKNKIRTRKEL